MSRMGAIMAAGILDAGMVNCTCCPKISSPVMTARSATLGTDPFNCCWKDLIAALTLMLCKAKRFFGMLLHTCMVYPSHLVMSMKLDLQFNLVSSMAKVLSAALCASFAGGRNVTVGLRSHSGYFRRTSVVALAIFSQYWYWYPLSYFLTLTLQPTALLGLNSDLQMPKLQVSWLLASLVRPACMHPSHTVLHDCILGREA